MIQTSRARMSASEFPSSLLLDLPARNSSAFALAGFSCAGWSCRSALHLPLKTPQTTETQSAQDRS